MRAKREKKHQPQRACLGCGAKKPQGELLRIASQSGNSPITDSSGKAKGRGGYVCFDLSCAERALKRRAFERTLKLKTSVPPELRAALEEVIKRKAKS